MRNIFLIALFGQLLSIGNNAQAAEMSSEDRVKRIDVMNKYALGIDTKDYKLFRSIFSDDVEVNILYTPNYGTDNTVSIKGADNWVNYVDREISKFIVPNANYAVRVLCIDGHKFVNTNNYADIWKADGAGVALANSIVQMFEERDGKSLPTKC